MTPSRPPPPDPREAKEGVIRFIFSMVIGAIMMLAGTGVIVYDVMTPDPRWQILSFGIGLVMLGGVAMLPMTFVPLFRSVLSRMPWTAAPPPPPPTDEDDGQL